MADCAIRVAHYDSVPISPLMDSGLWVDPRIARCQVEELARPERFELPTNWFEASYSIQLSYGRVIDQLYTL